MGFIKPTGKDTYELKRLKLHGSAPKRDMAKHAGTLRRLAEKPKGGGKK